MVYTAFARMPWPLLDLKCPFDLTVTHECLMVERSGKLRYLHNPQAGLSLGYDLRRKLRGEVIFTNQT
jgi:hypothetical protein